MFCQMSNKIIILPYLFRFMKYVIVYWSRYGNGKRIVERLGERLGARGEVSTLRTDESVPSSLPHADIYVFSAPAEKFTIPGTMRSFIRDMDGVEGKKCALINTHALKKRNWLKKMEKLVSKKNMDVVAMVDFRVDGDVENGSGLMEGWEAKLDEFAASL